MFDFPFFFSISQHPAWEQFLSADNLPETMNTPSPVLCSVSGCFCETATFAFTTSKMKKLYLSTSASSCSRRGEN
jgi:hypothetical protein